jgi:hypothetical protein
MDKFTISFLCTIIQILCIFIISHIDNPYLKISIVIFQIILLIYQIIIVKK